MDVKVLKRITFFTIRYILLLGVLVSTKSVIESEKRCDITENSRILNYCSHQWSKVTCEMVTMATSNETSAEVDLKQYLKFVLEFRILSNMYRNRTYTFHGTSNRDNASNAEAYQECLTLEKLSITKEKIFNGKFYNSEIVPLPLLLQLVGLADMNIVFEFNTTRPVAQVSFINRSSIVQMDYHINSALEVGYNPSVKNIIEEKLRTFSKLEGNIGQLHIVQSANFDVKIWENTVCNKSLDLKINGGRWNHLGKKQLPQMFFLKVLDLSNNDIQEIENDTFEQMPNLERLSISNNKLLKLPSSITTLKNLQVLDLSSNPSIEIYSNKYILRNLRKLTLLNLSYIPLNILEPLKILYDQRNSSNLLGLHLRKCNLFITEKDVEFFDHMSFLIELDLSENQLSSLPVNLFRSLKYLRSLRLSSNRFSHIDLDFMHSINFEFLDLSHNKIVDLHNVQIKGNVSEINLSDNSIMSWQKIYPYIYFEDHLNFETKCLNLSYNSLTNISEDMKNIFETLNSVDLGGNPLDCNSCNTPLLQKWSLENKTTTILNLGKLQHLKCGDLENSLRDITKVKFNVTLCSLDSTDPDYALVIGVPLLVLLALVLLSLIAVFGYRYEITYIRHLLNIRRQKHLKESQSAERYKYDAFVSYSAADRDWVMKELQPHLEQGAERYRLCLHERDFALGSIIADNIVECMKDSRNTLVVLTPHFVKSQWCRWELEVANHKLFEDDREFLVLVELKELNKKTLPRHLAYLLDTRTYLEWPTGHGSHPRAWARLKSALGESLYQIRMKQKNKTKDVEKTTADCSDII